MKVGIPPVVVLFSTAFLMWLVNWLTGSMLSYEFEVQRHLELLCFTLCMVSVLSGIYGFARNKTTVDPMNPDKAEHLVTGGIYAYSRNPMYLGMVFLLLGWGTKLGNPLNGVILSSLSGLSPTFRSSRRRKPYKQSLVPLTTTIVSECGDGYN